MKYFSVLLVDDDPLVIEDLKENIKWEYLGFKLCGSSPNGKIALKMCRELKPDVVITDIVMPHMNGIDFIHELRSINQNTYILVLSSYGEFEYAKSAMRDGVADYLLKLEMTHESLSDKLKIIYQYLFSSKRQIQKATQLELQEYFSRPTDNYSEFIFQRSSIDTKFIACIMTIRSLYFRATSLQPIDVLLEALEGSPLYEKGTDISFKQDKYVFYLLSPSQFQAPLSFDIRSKLSRIIDSLDFNNKDKLSIAYFIFPLSLRNLHDQFHRYHSQIDWFLFQESTKFHPLEDLNKLHYQTGSNQLTFKEIADQSNESQLEFIHRNSLASFDNHDLESLANNYFAIQESINVEPSAEDFLLQISDRTIWEDFVTDAFHQWQQLSSSVSPTNYSSTVHRAIEYIDSHSSEYEITIENIADFVGLSSGRLSVLFKKETGKTPLEWLTDIRIKKAISLLLHSNYKIYEISEKIGYRSSQYFSQVFYQHTGKKPLDYRNNSSITLHLGSTEKI